LKYYLPLIFPLVALIAVILTSEITVNNEPISDVIYDHIDDDPDYETPECLHDECFRDTPTAVELNSIIINSH